MAQLATSHMPHAHEPLFESRQAYFVTNMPSFPLKQTPIQPKRGRPTANPCWRHFDRLDEQNVRCRLCGKVVKTACSTNMMRHLERHHPFEYQNVVLIRQQRQAAKSAPTSPRVSWTTGQQTVSLVSSPIVNNEQPIFAPQRSLSVTAPFPEVTLDDFDFFNDFHPFGECEQSAHDLACWDGTMNSFPSVESSSTSPTNSSEASLPFLTTMIMDKKIRRRRKTEHPVWEFFVRNDDGTARCGICTATVRSPCSSNFMRHLMRHHVEEHKRVYAMWSERREAVQFAEARRRVGGSHPMAEVATVPLQPIQQWAFND